MSNTNKKRKNNQQLPSKIKIIALSYISKNRCTSDRFLSILTTRVCFLIFCCSALRSKKYLKLFYDDMISDTKYG